MGMRDQIMRAAITTSPSLLEFAELSAGVIVCDYLYAKQDQNYFDFYKRMGSVKGDVLILKTSDPYNTPMAEYFDLAHEVGANYIKQPHMTNPQNNIDSFEKFRDHWHSDRARNRTTKMMCVPHGGNIRGWRKQLTKMMSDLYVSAICIDGSDASEGEEGKDVNETRKQILYSLSRPSHISKKYYVHLLGTYGTYSEFLSGAYRDVNSIETSSPVLRGILGQRIKEDKFENFEPINDKSALDLFEDYTDNNEVDILYNICRLLKGAHTMEASD